MDPSALNSPELQQFINQEKEKAMVNEMVAKLTTVCWDKCITGTPGTRDAIIKMIRYKEFFRFYKGMRTKTVQCVFAASLLFMLKEELVKAYILLENKSKNAVKELSTHV